MPLSNGCQSFSERVFSHQMGAGAFSPEWDILPQLRQLQKKTACDAGSPESDFGERRGRGGGDPFSH